MKEILNYLKETIIGTILVLIIILFIMTLKIGIEYLSHDRYDVNEDGKVNAQDYVEIKNYIMEK